MDQAKRMKKKRPVTEITNSSPMKSQDLNKKRKVSEMTAAATEKKVEE